MRRVRRVRREAERGGLQARAETSGGSGDASASRLRSHRSTAARRLTAATQSSRRKGALCGETARGSGGGRCKVQAWSPDHAWSASMSAGRVAASAVRSELVTSPPPPVRASCVLSSHPREGRLRPRPLSRPPKRGPGFPAVADGLAERRRRCRKEGTPRPPPPLPPPRADLPRRRRSDEQGSSFRRNRGEARRSGPGVPAVCVQGGQTLRTSPSLPLSPSLSVFHVVPTISATLSGVAERGGSRDACG